MFLKLQRATENKKSNGRISMKTISYCVMYIKQRFMHYYEYKQFQIIRTFEYDDCYSFEKFKTAGAIEFINIIAINKFYWQFYAR